MRKSSAISLKFRHRSDYDNLSPFIAARSVASDRNYAMACMRLPQTYTTVIKVISNNNNNAFNIF